MSPTAITTSAALGDFLRENERVHVLGNGSKTALHGAADGVALADLSALSGVLEYEPSEYTITLGAGTAISHAAAVLAEKGQYLPFDPLLADRATIGGTVAANLSGSRRFRYGGVRDFVLGARVVDGLGRAFRVGGKVVKNAAGFDLSKFLVGSLGHYAIMTELTFKVFPDAPRFRSLRLDYPTLPDLLTAISFINRSVFELDALDFAPAAGGWSLLARLAGSSATLPPRVERFSQTIRQESSPSDINELEETATLWDPLAGLTGGTTIKVLLSPRQIPDFDRSLGETQRRYSIGGNLAWLATDDVGSLDASLRRLGLRGLCLLGAVESPLIGAPLENELAARVKSVLDPHGKLV